jgi:Flp pilus assembly protein TadG
MSWQFTKKNSNGRFTTRESGQGLVEFALVLPLLAIMILAIVQLGVLYNNYETLTDATRAGARVAAVTAVSTCKATAEQAVRDSAYNLNQSQLTPNATCAVASGSQLTVTATYPYSINLLGFVVKSGTLTSTTKERKE